MNKRKSEAFTQSTVNKRKSTAIDKPDGEESISTVPKAAEVRQRINLQRMQNVVLVWLDNNIDENNHDCQNTIIQLQRVVNDINTFIDVDQCFEFVETILDKKASMVISGSLAQHFVPFVHNMPQIHSIFIFCDNQNHDEQWTKDWPKIKGVFTDITPICEALKEAAHQCEQNAIPMSFVDSNKKLDQLDPSFMYTQILKEIILTIKFEQKHIQDYLNYCHDASSSNKKEIENIKLFEAQYHKKTPIYWYTCDMFLYPMLNRAVRLIDGDIITRMGFFIGDLHRHIEQLHQEQYAGTTDASIFTVYRGQGLSAEDFEKITKIKGGLISFNNFLSASKDRAVSNAFAESNLTNPDLIAVLFVMKVDLSQSTIPFASIAEISFFKEEEEVLFSMHSVFRILDIKQMGENNRLYEVSLTLTADNDPELSRLTDYIRQESYPQSKGWYRLGLVLSTMGQFDKAEDIYYVLLDQTEDNKEKADIHRQLGSIKHGQGKYEEALTLFEKSLIVKQNTLPPNHPDFASTYGNIGNVHYNMGNYPKALLSHEKALAIWQQSLPANHPNLASSYYNMSNVHRTMGNYPKALSSNQKALEIWQQSLPANHPNLAASYGNIGNVHFNMGNYPKALCYCEKALDIQQKSLPPNHPDLASTYGNIGNVHYNMGNYPNALSYYEKSLIVKQNTLPPNHLRLASSYVNIGNVHYNKGNYPNALSYYEKALEIQQQSLPPNHPDLAYYYKNIGLAHHSMGNYPKALSFHEKAREIRQESLPPNHPTLAYSYHNIGMVHYSMGDYPKALLDLKKALEISHQSLPPNHPKMVSFYRDIGVVHYNMGNFSKALSYYEKAIESQQQSLPPNHPDLASSYKNIGKVHFIMSDNSKALSSHEKALEILQQSLPCSHPRLAYCYGHIGQVHRNMGNYPKALSSHEKALEILQESLRPNHPHLAYSYGHIGSVYNHMGNYPKALSSHEKALEIWQQLLPPNHPNLIASYNSIGEVHRSMGNYPKALPSLEKAFEIQQQSLSSQSS
ncbi:unnamed protein product [Adineta steineri]|uniref:NAD(P)(+)--arginine ADP-ribosyltransferase n=1 Tax=Adineta steineri TaxID=433720 RepID=A0A819DI87_9BILA|nr:unnamed protein product [Adineta steineri]